MRLYGVLRGRANPPALTRRSVHDFSQAPCPLFQMGRIDALVNRMRLYGVLRR
ncbi:hypothetical protein [Lysobacter gummosus]|uniref:hypothetical protein n=1 Tax=Lysobacter gummosus TaxID=262324 RepID=UPI00363E2F07